MNGGSVGQGLLVLVSLSVGLQRQRDVSSLVSWMRVLGECRIIVKSENEIFTRMVIVSRTVSSKIVKVDVRFGECGMKGFVVWRREYLLYVLF